MSRSDTHTAKEKVLVFKKTKFYLCTSVYF